MNHLTDLLEQDRDQSATLWNNVDSDVVLTRVRREAKRKRVTRSVVTSAAVVVAIAGIGAGAWAIADQSNMTPAVILVTPSPSPTPTPSEAPTPEPSASAEPAPSAPVLVAAPHRGDGFPEAFEVNDDVWAQVGPGWSMASASHRVDPYDETPPPLPNAVLYLVSPDEVYYEVQVLPLAQSKGLRVVSWHEQSRIVGVTWEGDGGAALVDLSTGFIDHIEFTWQGKKSVHASFITANARGDELWRAGFNGGMRFYRFSETDGWTVAAPSELEGIESYLDEGESGWQAERYGPWAPVGPYGDGNAFAVEYRSEATDRMEPDDRRLLRVGIYRLDTDTIVTQSVDLPECYLDSWNELGELTYVCWGEKDLYRTISVPGVGEPLGPRMPRFTETEGVTSRVGYGEPSPPGVGYYQCGC